MGKHHIIFVYKNPREDIMFKQHKIHNESQDIFLLQQKIIHLNSELVKYKGLCEHLKNYSFNENQQKENVLLEERNKSLENQVKQQKRELSEVVKRYTEQIKEISEKEMGYLSSIKGLEMDLCEKEEEINSLLSLMSKLEKKHQEVSSFLDTNQQNFNILESENERLVQLNNELRNTINKLEEETSNIESKTLLNDQYLKEVEMKLVKLEECNQNLISENEKLRNERDSYEVSYQELLSQLDSMKTQFEALKDTSIILQTVKQTKQEDSLEIIEQLANKILQNQASLSKYTDQLINLEFEVEEQASILMEMKNDPK